MINWIKKHWPLVWKSTWADLNREFHYWVSAGERDAQLLRGRLAMATTERDAAVHAFNESRDKANDLLEEKNTVERMLQETRASRDAAEAKALGFQRKFAELVPQWERGHLAFMPWHQKTVTWTTWATDPHTEVRTSTADVRTVTTSIRVSLNSDTPPEIIAEKLAASIRDAVLKEYQKQSILGT